MTETTIEHNPGTAPHPVRAAHRIGSIDVLRGFALLGILLINVTGFGLPVAAIHNPTIAGGDSGINLGVWVATELFVNGSLFAIFSMLFGAGVILLITGKPSTSDAGLTIADIYYRRTILLILFGVIHAYLMLMRGDILYTYGMVALFLFPLCMMKAHTLLIAGLSVILWRGVFTWSDINATVDLHTQAQAAEMAMTDGGFLTEAQQGAIEAWSEIKSGKTTAPDAIAAEIQVHHYPYMTQVSEYASENAYMQTVSLYKTQFWKVLSMMLIGMGLYRLGVFSAQRSLAFYLSLIVMGYGIGGAVRGWLLARYIADISDPLFLIIRGEVYDTRLLLALGHIGMVMIFFKLGWMQWLFRRLAAIAHLRPASAHSQPYHRMIIFGEQHIRH